MGIRVRKELLLSGGIGFIVVSTLYATFLYLPFCKGDNCTIQGWLGSLSGWVAAAAAFVTVGVLKHQTDSQARQLSHLLGEDSPSVEHWLTNTLFCVIRVTNWNRQRFKISRIEIDTGPEIRMDAIYIRERDGLFYLPILGPDREIDPRGNLSNDIVVEGWENTSAQPSDVFICFACSPAHDPQQMNFPGRAEVRLRGQLSSITPQNIDLAIVLNAEALLRA